MTDAIVANESALSQAARESEVLQHQERYGGRTEAQILGREPITIQLGGESYAVRPAVIRIARMFADKRATVVLDALKLDKINTDDAEAFAASYAKILGNSESQLDMIRLYASEMRDGAAKCYLPLPDDLEDKCTAEEVAIAYAKVEALADAPLEVTGGKK